MKTSACSFAGWGGRRVKGKGKCKWGDKLFCSYL